MKHLLTFVMLILSLLLFIACGDGSNDNSDLCANYLYFIDGKCTCLDGKNQLGEACTNPFENPPVVDGDTVDGDTIDGDAIDGDDDASVSADTITAHGITLKVVSIPAGTFEMGCSPNDDKCLDDELPRHTVNVPKFRMAKSETTNAQYAAFLNYHGNKCDEKECKLSTSVINLDGDGEKWVVARTYETHPVYGISHYGARAFCDAMGGRLPSEAEWEYAARAGTTTKYYCGDDLNCLDKTAWYVKNSNSITHPVCHKTANDFGLCDMLGNMYEICEDANTQNYKDAPTDGSVWFHGFPPTYFASRGGGITDVSYGYIRISSRVNSGGGGFRCVFQKKKSLT